MRTHGLPAVLLLTACLSGCYESSFPLDSSPQADADPRVVGSWRCVSPDAGDEAMTLVVTRGAAARTYALMLQEAKNDPEHYEAYVSSVKGTQFVNVRNPKQTAKQWVYARYALMQANVLLVQIVQERLLKSVPQTASAVRAAIERERLNPSLYADAMVCIRSQ